MGNIKPTGHKTFDVMAAKDYIGTGNVFSNIQRSGYVRAFNNLECNGFDRQPGELQAFDLKSWVENRNFQTPKHILRFVREVAVNDSVILYMFRHFNSRKEMVVHGFAVTTAKHELLNSWVTGPTHKSRSIVAECVKHVVGGDK